MKLRWVFAGDAARCIVEGRIDADAAKIDE